MSFGAAVNKFENHVYAVLRLHVCRDISRHRAYRLPGTDTGGGGVMYDNRWLRECVWMKNEMKTRLHLVSISSVIIWTIRGLS